MVIRDVLVYTPAKAFLPGEVRIENGKIVEVNIDPEGVVPKGQKQYLIPGLIDLHFHGCMGADFCDGTKAALDTIAKYEASIGVTTIAPATMTLPVDELKDILSVAAEYRKEHKDSTDRAEIVGINMEGPFISPVKKGAQNEKYIITCDSNIAKEFVKVSEGLVKFIGVAPEESDNYLEFINEVKGFADVSLAHTNADYDTAKKAFGAGANHAVHLYNAMPAYTHRAPGVVGAVADSEHVMAEMICDGIHLHPSAVRTTMKMLGEDRVIIISDSMRATGMPDGQYTLGGLDVNVKGKYATLVSDGALAGSVTNLMDCMKTAVTEMEIPLETAVACVTMNPARSLGIESEYGSIEPGKVADLVLLDDSLQVQKVWKRGREI